VLVNIDRVVVLARLIVLIPHLSRLASAIILERTIHPPLVCHLDPTPGSASARRTRPTTRFSATLRSLAHSPHSRERVSGIS
jgi:hypothetical protein